MGKNRAAYIPALEYHFLTRFYDPLLRWTMPEAAFKGRLLDQARIGVGEYVLDLGCGTGTLTLLVKERHPDAVVVGLDADLEALALTRTKAERAGRSVALHCARASQLPYADGSFDRVLSSLLFHHLTRMDKLRAMGEVFRVLRVGGELHVADFGRPHNARMKLLSFVVRSFEEIADNVQGLLPPMLRGAGFCDVEETVRYATVFGTLSLYRARKSA